MRRILPVFVIGLLWSGPVLAQGLLIPSQVDVPPLAMREHQVTIAIRDQVAVTRVVQTFRNDTSRALEATYVFPVPKGASVKKFTMWVDGKEVRGELVEADKARQIYTDIVRRTQDPGLLEYMGNNLLRLRVFPVPAHGDQKLSLSFTSVAACDGGLIEYVYPLKTNGKAAPTAEKFSIHATLRSQHPIQNVYSPTHAIQIKRPNDHTAEVAFEKNQGTLDKDFQLFYTPADKDIGLTALCYRPVKSADGYFMLLISPRAELSKQQQVARDMVFVLDTSGSMAGVKMEQARKALKFCLGNLTDKDRFGLMNFATTVNPYRQDLVRAGRAEVAEAKRWVDRLEADGGTAIDDALKAALAMRSSDTSRSFTVVFFTDGQPTVGEMNPDQIQKNVAAKNTANTRIFTFGVGDDVNAVLLDRLADSTRAVSTYVRPEEDIEVKVSSLYAKISHPVLTNLRLAAGSGIELKEIYPAQLPDLFHGGQLVVLGRYHGKSHAAVTLTGAVGKERKEFVYEVNFPSHTGEGKAFVEDLWARRKVGYLLDQIRTNGKKKELVDEVVALAKKHGITTPFTSYLVVPDGPAPVASSQPVVPGDAPTLSQGAAIYYNNGYAINNSTAVVPQSAAPPAAASYGVRSPGNSNMGAAFQRGVLDTDGSITGAPGPAAPDAATIARQVQGPGGQPGLRPMADTEACTVADMQTGKGGVDYAVQMNNLRNQNQLSQALARQVAGRNCVQVGGVWIDDGFNAKLKTVAVKAQSKAYFRILERHPAVKEVFQLGNRLVWVTPANVALVVDTRAGKEKLTDAEIDRLFVAKK
jgi:Ca-activated chloride channel family protein